MSREIRLSEELYKRIENNAEGFADTPENVIERLLNFYESASTAPNVSKKDTTKYEFDGVAYGKSRLVLAIIKYHVEEKKINSLEQLSIDFPANLQGSIGVFNEYDFVYNKYKTKPNKRHFIKDRNDFILVEGERFVVCTEWGVSNIENFLTKAKGLGYKIDPV